MKLKLSNPNEKIVAKNAFLLLIRMALLMVINLVAVRFVRSGLGIEDYGLLNVVTGLVQIVICLKTILETATQRFFSISLGKQDMDEVRDLFSVSVRLSKELSLLVLLGMETIGLWFVCTQVNCPDSRYTAMLIVYQLAVLNFIATLLQVPYLASVLAYERMDYFAFVTILEAIVCLAAALLVFVVPGDRMIFYAIMLVVSNLLGYVLYRLYVNRKIGDIYCQQIKSKELYRKMLSFSGWTVYGSLSAALMFQGNMLVLNVFVGPVANAAFAVALQINNAITNLGNNVIMAVKPQMVMNYSKGNFRQLNRLFLLSTLALVVVMGGIIIPLEVWLPDILTLWLGDVDYMTIIFSRLVIIVSFLLMIGAPITIIMHAVGCVKQYHLMVETITILCLPASYVCLSLGLAPESVCWSMIAIIIIAHFSRIFCFWKYYLNRMRKSSLH